MRCCAAIIPGGAAPIDREQAAPPYPWHRLSLGIGIIRIPNSKNPKPEARTWGLAKLVPPVKSLIAHFAADLGLAGDKIGNDVILTLRAGDFDFADFHAVAI